MKRNIVVAIWLILVVLLMVYPFAHAQEHRHGDQVIAGAAGRYYSNWMRPDNRALSCCSQYDCYATEARYVNGQWFARQRETGKFILIDPSKIETERGNPDGQNHVCMSRAGLVFCFIAGGGT